MRYDRFRPENVPIVQKLSDLLDTGQNYCRVFPSHTVSLMVPIIAHRQVFPLCDGSFRSEPTQFNSWVESHSVAMRLLYC